jgi:hypothetical protein
MTELAPSSYLPSVSHAAESEYHSKGWRSFFRYRDLGVKAATGNDYDVRLVRSQGGSPVPTGWHHHLLNVQIVYCVGGFEVIALADGQMVKLVPGTCLNIPPGFAHNEIGYSADMEMLVITNPGNATTVPVDPPEGWDEEAIMSKLEEETAPARRSSPWTWRPAERL